MGRGVWEDVGHAARRRPLTRPAAAGVYRDVLMLARELQVPLPARAARVLVELAAPKEPGEAEARELASRRARAPRRSSSAPAAGR